MASSHRIASVIPVRLRWQIKRLSNIHIQGPLPNIFLFATARSGSTWLKEIIATQPGIKFIDEPLNMGRFQSTSGPLPPSWEFLLPHPGREEVLERYFEDLIHNRIGVAGPSPFNRFHRVLSRRLIFKIQRCMDLMNWFEERFGGRIVYLVRHPIPVSLSHRCNRGALFLANDLFCARHLTEEQRVFGRKVLKQGSPLEQKVLGWCLQNLSPLKFLDRSRWLCLHYEDLVLEPEATLRHVARELELPRLDRMLKQVGRPADCPLPDAETRRFLARTSIKDDRSYLVRKWREKITEQDEARTFEIMDRFGIDTYAFGEDMPVKHL